MEGRGRGLRFWSLHHCRLDGSGGNGMGDGALGGCHDAVILADALGMGGSSPPRLVIAANSIEVRIIFAQRSIELSSYRFMNL